MPGGGPGARVRSPPVIETPDAPGDASRAGPRADTPGRWWRAAGSAFWAIPVATLLVGLPLIVAVAVLHGRPWHPVLDLAMTEFRVRDVFTGHTPLIGLPGRIGEYPDQGSHPGSAELLPARPDVPPARLVVVGDGGRDGRHPPRSPSAPGCG